MRDVAKRAGISHTYLSIVEKGFDLRSGSPVNPTPETLKALSLAYNHSYEDLMLRAGYIEVNDKESVFTLPESEYDRVIKEAEAKYGVNLRNDPVVNATVRELILGIAKTLKKNQ